MHGAGRWHPDSPDELLVERVAAGDRDALACLYDRYERLVFSLALRMVRDPHLAEEVVQDVFLRLWQRAGQFAADRGRFSAWLLHITRNLAVDRIRRHRPLLPAPASAEPPQDPPADAALLAVQVRQALAALSPEQRAALEMAYFDGLTHTEIAARTGEPLGTVKSRLYHGLLRLRAILAEEGPLQARKEGRTRHGQR